MIIYNGFAPGETRETRRRPRKRDRGHTVVLISQTRRGAAFAFTYRLECQCGQTFRSRQTIDRTYHAHAAHLRSVLNQPT